MFAGCVAPGGLFGAKSGVRFGVLSDLHVTDWASAEVFRKALAYFRGRDVDAVMITGDLTDHGLLPQLENVAKSWYEVFPYDRGPGGKTVEKLFVTGNHDICGLGYRDATMDASFKAMNLTYEQAGRLTLARQGVAKCWEQCFYEPYLPIYSKRVKGFDFIGGHWDQSDGIRGLEAAWEANVAKVDTGRPFFYFQHGAPRATVFGDDSWGHDLGQSTLCLRDFPNAVAFSGHSHLPLTDGRCVWRGGFTSISASSLSYVCMPDGEKRRNAPDYRTNLDCRHGMVVDAYDDRLVIERRDFVHDEPLGDDLVFAMPTRGSTFEVRAFSREELPAFPRKAGVSAAVEGDALVVRFLGAFENPTARPYEYRVSVEYVLADGGKGRLESRWFQADACFSRTRAAKAENVVTVPLAELPEGAVQARVRLTPMNCYGGAGKDTVSDSVCFKSRI